MRLARGSRRRPRSRRRGRPREAEPALHAVPVVGHHEHQSPGASARGAPVGAVEDPVVTLDDVGVLEAVEAVEGRRTVEQRQQFGDRLGRVGYAMRVRTPRRRIARRPPPIRPDASLVSTASTSVPSTSKSIARRGAGSDVAGFPLDAGPISGRRRRCAMGRTWGSWMDSMTESCRPLWPGVQLLVGLARTHDRAERGPQAGAARCAQGTHGHADDERHREESEQDRQDAFHGQNPNAVIAGRVPARQPSST